MATSSHGRKDRGAPLLEAVGLQVRVGRRTLVGPVDLRLEPGRWIALVGPNGAGKSTLLKALATLMPFEGRLAYRGRPVAAVGPQYRRSLGVVLHEPLLYRELSARENLMLFARMYGVRDRRETAERRLEAVGLSAYAGEFVRRYSRGMQQRLALARATLHDPEVLLLDEPLSGIDAAGAARMLELFAAAKRSGTAALWVTHNWMRAWPLVDEIWEMARGAIARRTATAGQDPGAWRPLHADGADGQGGA